MDIQTITSARNIAKRYGKNYYFATVLFPTRIRDAVFILYAFVRIPDEIVDNPATGSDPTELLQAWKADWKAAYETNHSDQDILLAAREIFLKYKIPFSLSSEFIAAMIQDLTVARYETYADLQAYMRGSAEVIGLMMTRIIGHTSDSAFQYAEKLGEAMQLTNFIRDIGEDYRERNRIYLPAEDLRRFNVTEADFETTKTSANLKLLLQYQIARARTLYQEAEPGIALLNREGQLAVRTASRLYSNILDIIEENKYEILHKKVVLSPLKKLFILITVYVKK